jgi:hypothetical protein
MKYIGFGPNIPPTIFFSCSSRNVPPETEGLISEYLSLQIFGLYDVPYHYIYIKGKGWDSVQAVTLTPFHNFTTKAPL